MIEILKCFLYNRSMRKKRTIFVTMSMMLFFSLTAMVFSQAGDQKTRHKVRFHKGKVLTTMNSGGYTYVEIQEKDKRTWAAARQFDVSVGDTVEFPGGMLMKNFNSKTLNRTFESILFVSVMRVVKPGEGPTTGTMLPKGHLPVGRKKAKAITVKPGSVKKAEDGQTVAECYSLKDSLAGKTVRVRGKVVKFTARIMGKNWLHIQDGSAEGETGDLTVTTKETVNVGDLVVVTGKIAYDKNFGAGYVYKVIVEDAAVTVE